MPESQLWLMLVNSVSGENKTARMRIWRALKASGAAALRDGVYLLPKSESARTVFAEQAQEVVAAGGMAHIVAFDGEDDATMCAMPPAATTSWACSANTVRALSDFEQ